MTSITDIISQIDSLVFLHQASLLGPRSAAIPRSAPAPMQNLQNMLWGAIVAIIQEGRDFAAIPLDNGDISKTPVDLDR